MENQHRKIKGYRELSQEELDLMNEIKEKAKEVGELVDKLYDKESLGPGHKWVISGETQLQLGFMCLTRAVAKPEFF